MNKDFSCEFEKPIAYTRLMADHFSNKWNYESDGSMILDDFQTTPFESMLYDIAALLKEVDEHLHGKKYLKAA